MCTYTWNTQAAEQKCLQSVLFALVFRYVYVKSQRIIIFINLLLTNQVKLEQEIYYFHYP